MKKLIIAVIGAVTFLAAITTEAQQPVYGSVSQPVISTAAGTRGASGVAWTNFVNAVYTNRTVVSTLGTRYTALEFHVNCMATNATSTNAVWQLTQSVSGGTGVVLLQTVTNTIPANSTSSDTVVVKIQNDAVPYVYVYSLKPDAATVGLTNSTVYAKGL